MDNFAKTILALMIITSLLGLFQLINAFIFSIVFVILTSTFITSPEIIKLFKKKSKK